MYIMNIRSIINMQVIINGRYQINKCLVFLYIIYVQVYMKVSDLFLLRGMRVRYVNEDVNILVVYLGYFIFLNFIVRSCLF